MRQKVEFVSGQHTLAGLLELPDSEPNCYALFAHCFTCGKDIAAASRISKALTAQGIAVLRFDFTGLGNSDGDFSNTNFSSNLQDLLAAADFLRDEFHAPQIIIGHSLGGAAVLAMAGQVPECNAVVTIGAPHMAEHVVHNFEMALDEIQETGEANVKLGVREFTIKKQFLEDLEKFDDAHIGQLRKALLVMHSPIDATVGIQEAEKIYKAAKHPKSFVSLNQSDHLVSKAKDANYIANTIAAWVSLYVDQPELQKPNIDKGHVYVSEVDHKFKQYVATDDHLWLADEPVAMGGKNSGPDPYEHLLGALGTCTAMTVRMFADRNKFPLSQVDVTLKHSRVHCEDMGDCADDKPKQIEVIDRVVQLQGDLTEDQKQTLLKIADRCPVHKTLHSELQVQTKLA